MRLTTFAIDATSELELRCGSALFCVIGKLFVDCLLTSCMRLMLFVPFDSNGADLDGERASDARE